MSRVKEDLSNSHHRNPASGARATSSLEGVHMRPIPHVGIVGAGIAGLRCADVLLQHRVKVTILEARQRVGGRLCQREHQGHLVDLGANWIHGTNDNPILDLAKATGTITHRWDGRESIFDADGELMPAKEAFEYTETLWDIVTKAMKYSNDECPSIDPGTSLLDEVKAQAKTRYPDPFAVDDSALEKRGTLERLAEMWGAFIGSPVSRQSLKFFWLEETLDGENLFVAGTYKKILDYIAKPALAQSEVLLGHKVVRVTSTDSRGPVMVAVETPTGQSRMSFDQVVVTAPLGWLKNNKGAFVPPLPARLSQAIDSISYGQLDKFYITFPTAFWDTPASGTNGHAHPGPAPARQTVPNTTATVAPPHQPSPPPFEARPAEHYPGFTFWSSPLYAPSTNPNHWSQECVSMAALPSGTAHPTLLFYTFGPTSKHLSRLVKRGDVLNPGSVMRADSKDGEELKSLEDVDDFFRPYYSRLPNYSPDAAVCMPTAILATNWTGDELAGYGSYCNFQVGLERGDEDVEVMREGIPEKGVWFAGEHTAPFVALGTVTGAYWSGEGVAERILSSYGLQGRAS